MNYLAHFQGRFIGITQWDDFNALMEKLISEPADDWYLYDTTTSIPKDTLSADALIEQLIAIKTLIKIEHQKRYCGIMYVDDLENQNFIKIFHPNNLGKSCGSREHPPIPQWLLSKIKPVDVVEKFGPLPIKQGFISKYLKF
ncbi:hypothetical protein SPONN_2812 [uncultured Candidatus Thioglobus sp.]|nr:hypothetical protein SPONN_2812 [uncultured Candidatus Thioglobus sp.]